MISMITALSSKYPDKLSSEEKETLFEYQNKLDTLYQSKAKGAFVRSRRRWMEEGEQNSAYFFRLEKSQSKNNTIHQLRIDNIVCDDANQIANFCSNFYKNLYSSQYCDDNTVSFLEPLVDINPINTADQEFCDRPISLKEIVDSINNVKNNKSPGVDGLTSEFYKSFSEELAPFLLEVFCESIAKGVLPPTLTQGLITLIPKPKKDLLLIDYLGG